jgi:hypothetical protein
MPRAPILSAEVVFLSAEATRQRPAGKGSFAESHARSSRRTCAESTDGSRQREFHKIKKENPPGSGPTSRPPHHHRRHHCHHHRHQHCPHQPPPPPPPAATTTTRRRHPSPPPPPPVAATRRGLWCWAASQFFAESHVDLLSAQVPLCREPDTRQRIFFIKFNFKIAKMCENNT